MARYARVVYSPRGGEDFTKQMVYDDDAKRYKNFEIRDPRGHEVIVSVQCGTHCKCEVNIGGVLHAYPFLPDTAYDLSDVRSFEVGLLVDGSFRVPPPYIDTNRNSSHPRHSSHSRHPEYWSRGEEPLYFQSRANVQALLDRLAEDVQRHVQRE